MFSHENGIEVEFWEDDGWHARWVNVAGLFVGDGDTPIAALYDLQKAMRGVLGYSDGYIHKFAGSFLTNH